MWETGGGTQESKRLVFKSQLLCIHSVRSWPSHVSPLCRLSPNCEMGTHHSPSPIGWQEGKCLNPVSGKTGHGA